MPPVVAAFFLAGPEVRELTSRGYVVLSGRNRKDHKAKLQKNSRPKEYEVSWGEGSPGGGAEVGKAAVALGCCEGPAFLRCAAVVFSRSAMDRFNDASLLCDSRFSYTEH